MPAVTAAAYPPRCHVSAAHEVNAGMQHDPLFTRETAGIGVSAPPKAPTAAEYSATTPLAAGRTQAAAEARGPAPRGQEAAWVDLANVEQSSLPDPGARPLPPQPSVAPAGAPSVPPAVLQTKPQKSSPRPGPFAGPSSPKRTSAYAESASGGYNNSSKKSASGLSSELLSGLPGAYLTSLGAGLQAVAAAKGPTAASSGLMGLDEDALAAALQRERDQLMEDVRRLREAAKAPGTDGAETCGSVGAGSSRSSTKAQDL